MFTRAMSTRLKLGLIDPLPPWVAAVVAASVATLAAGCAGLNNLTADVASFGEWPSGRSGGSYAFDRLPSQQSQAKATETLEQAAQGALAKAGFKPVAQGQQPDVLVQLGARLQRSDPSPWTDVLWWRGGWAYGYGRPALWVGPGPWHVGPAWALHARADTRRYEREVALLIRDRASGKPLYETRASVESFSRGDATTVAALFDAALVDFPKAEAKPKRVTVVVAP